MDTHILAPFPGFIGNEATHILFLLNPSSKHVVMHKAQVELRLQYPQTITEKTMYILGSVWLTASRTSTKSTAATAKEEHMSLDFSLVILASLLPSVHENLPIKKGYSYIASWEQTFWLLTGGFI